MRIDPHVHCRDGAESYKETIEHVFRLCDEQGVDIVFDMPNCVPPVLSADDVERRLALVPKQAAGRYRIFIGATTDEVQLRAAASAAADMREVVGLKLYAGQSVGPLAVSGEPEQRRIYEILAAAGYTGVLAVHCEKSSLMVPAFMPDAPHTHGLARPPQAEVESVRDQIAFAADADFKGVLHICHISTFAALELVRAARRRLRLTCGVTPHHLLWTSSELKGKDGLIYKVNPPLRSLRDAEALREAVRTGAVDWIETDHAPHALCEKLYAPYLSGFPSLCIYRMLVEDFLPLIGVSAEKIRQLTCDNIRRIFGERKLA